MGRKKNSLAMAELSGAAVQHPSRYEHKDNVNTTSIAGPLGKPPSWFTKQQASMWRHIAKQFPWLTSNDRTVFENAVRLQCRIRYERDCPVSVYAEANKLWKSLDSIEGRDALKRPTAFDALSEFL